jgi:hypothetical protein
VIVVAAGDGLDGASNEDSKRISWVTELRELRKLGAGEAR